jgi:hypothetical protein
MMKAILGLPKQLNLCQASKQQQQQGEKDENLDCKKRSNSANNDGVAMKPANYTTTPANFNNKREVRKKEQDDKSNSKSTMYNTPSSSFSTSDEQEDELAGGSRQRVMVFTKCMSHRSLIVAQSSLDTRSVHHRKAISTAQTLRRSNSIKMKNSSPPLSTSNHSTATNQRRTNKFIIQTLTSDNQVQDFLTLSIATKSILFVTASCQGKLFVFERLRQSYLYFTTIESYVLYIR